MGTWTRVVLAVVVVVSMGACSRRTQVATPQPAPLPPPEAVTPTPPAPPRTGPQRVEDLQPAAGLAEDNIGNRSLDELNRDSPLRPAFFPLDSADLDDAGRAIVTSNVDVLKKYPQW